MDESKRLYILVSIPLDFQDKFMGFVNNLNTLNSEKKPLVIIEEAHVKKKQKFAAVPKNFEGEMNGR